MSNAFEFTVPRKCIRRATARVLRQSGVEQLGSPSESGRSLEAPVRFRATYRVSSIQEAQCFVRALFDHLPIDVKLR